MRSISIMPCDDLAGDAKRRVPLPLEGSKANAKHFRKSKANAKHLWNVF